MQINSVSSAYPIQPSNQVAGKVQPKLEQENVKDTKKVQSQEPTQSVNLDEKAIALAEQSIRSTLDFNKAKQTTYDQPSTQNRTAVAAYQSVDNYEQRQNVQQVLGVDIFA